jgi:hypothetical protein
MVLPENSSKIYHAITQIDLILMHECTNHPMDAAGEPFSGMMMLPRYSGASETYL